MRWFGETHLGMGGLGHTDIKLFLHFVPMTISIYIGEHFDKATIHKGP